MEFFTTLTPNNKVLLDSRVVAEISAFLETGITLFASWILLGECGKIGVIVKLVN